MKIYLMRHGQTEWNKAGRIQGSLDSPLTEAGKKELERWALFLKQEYPGIKHIYASPLPRTRATAAIITRELSLPISLIPELREQDWGDWEGCSWQEIEQNWPGELARQSSLGWDFCPRKGENRRLVRKRALTAMEKIIEDGTEAEILVICHQGIIRSLIYQLKKRKFLASEPKLLGKRSLQILETQGRTLSINQLNITLPPCT